MDNAWRLTLEELLNIPVHMHTVTSEQWEEELGRLLGVDEAMRLRSAGRLPLPGGGCRFVLHDDGKLVTYFQTEPGVLTAREERLVERLLQHAPDAAGEEADAGNGSILKRLGDWIHDQLKAGRTQAIIADEHNAGGRLNAERIPFLLTTDHAVQSAGDTELEKLLRSFLEEDIMIIPLREQEWLVLAPDSLLHEDIEGRDGEEEDTPEDVLAGIALGMYDMLASEWVGECHIAVGHPIVPALAAVETVSVLRETIMLGRKFHQGANIHLPWNVHLERLINSIPESQRIRYMEQVVNRSDLLLEPEIVSTLETFFAMNCNVSDTAKQLFIHRNTLLYRLDKLKQDTGLDVRLFRDAVLVKIIMLLYKVTKRK